jgi:hypothetical protein
MYCRVDGGWSENENWRARGCYSKMFLERADKGGGWRMMVLEWVFLF